VYIERKVHVESKVLLYPVRFPKMHSSNQQISSCPLSVSSKRKANAQIDFSVDKYPQKSRGW